MNSDIAIKVEHLTKIYNTRNLILDENGVESNEFYALKDVSFEIKKGESVGVIGPNGSGKSTLLKILAGVTKPTSGKVTINGKVASILDIGAGFHPELSGRENVYLNGQIHGFSKKEIEEKFDEIVVFSGIESFIDEPVKNYSNGMYLRLAFSIMAHLDFDIYLFDEVLSVGDAEFMLKTTEKTMQLAQIKKTIIYVSHNLQELENQDLYLLFEKGILKEKTRLTKVLEVYREKSIANNKNMYINTSNIVISDFSSYPTSKDLKIHSIKFYQHNIEETGFFCTNKPFFFEIEYEKLKDNNTIDVVVNVNDNKGISVLSTAPFIKGDFSKDTKSGKYMAKCIFPEYLFNAQIYFLSIFFPIDLITIINKNESNFFNEDYFGGNIVKMSVGFHNFIAFKGVLYKNNKIMDLSDVNFNGNLLAGFNWEK